MSIFILDIGLCMLKHRGVLSILFVLLLLYPFLNDLFHDIVELFVGHYFVASVQIFSFFFFMDGMRFLKYGIDLP